MSRDFKLIAKLISVAINDGANPEEARSAAMKAVELLAKNKLGPDYWHEFKGAESTSRNDVDYADWDRGYQAGYRRGKEAGEAKARRTEKQGRRGPTEQQSKAARIWAQRVAAMRANERDQNWDDFVNQF